LILLVTEIKITEETEIPLSAERPQSFIIAALYLQHFISMIVEYEKFNPLAAIFE
jgi:hypothetical protein